LCAHRAAEFKEFLARIDAAVPADLEVHLICDNCTHKTPAINAWLQRHPRFHMHFTPTSSSWRRSDDLSNESQAQDTSASRTHSGGLRGRGLAGGDRRPGRRHRPPTRTPWDSLNARLAGRAAVHMTIFAELDE
jgi:hypothetical protein